MLFFLVSSLLLITLVEVMVFSPELYNKNTLVGTGTGIHFSSSFFSHRRLVGYFARIDFMKVFNLNWGLKKLLRFRLVGLGDFPS